MKQYILISVFLFFNLFNLDSATLSESFRRFLRSRYGNSVDELLSREDMGGGGSFGGGINHIAGQPTLLALFLYISFDNFNYIFLLLINKYFYFYKNIIIV